MTVRDGETGAADIDQLRTPEPAGSASRDALGRFGTGNKISRGRPKSSITTALRRATDPQDVALYLVGLLHDEKANHRERLKAAEIILLRLDGAVPTTSYSYSVSAAARLLPAVCSDPDATPEQIRAELVAFRQRALAGEILNFDGDEDDEE